MNLGRSRLLLLGIIVILMFLVPLHRLFVLQIVEGQYHTDNFQLIIRREREITGTRGGIYDRNGNVLAYNELAHSVIIEDNVQGTFERSRNEILNEVLVGVMEIVESNGDTINTDFGIVLDAAGNYAFAMTNEFSRLRFLADIYGHLTIEDLTEYQANSTPTDVVEFLATDRVNGFGIDIENNSRDFVLKMVTMRYSIRLNSFTQYIPTTLASDVSDETVAAIMENQYRLIGVSVTEDYMRRYVDSIYFAGIIGYTGKISLEEYLALNEEQQQRYSMTDIIGKAGIEQVMEETLQGTKGSITFYVDSFGRVTEVVDLVEPSAGNNVYLTIDRDLQIQTYYIIQEKLAGIILSRLANIMDYDPSLEATTRDILIPIDNVYVNFIANGIVNSSKFSDAAEGTAQREIYEVFTARRQELIGEIVAYLNNPAGATRGDLTPEMQEVITHVIVNVLTTNSGIIMRSRIDGSDETHQAWAIDESINVNEYLNHLIAENWIDVSRLSDYIEMERYTEATEVYRGIVSFVHDSLQNDFNFESIIYRYLIRAGRISGGQIFASVYEQGFLDMNEDVYHGLRSGAVNPFNWILGMVESLTITPGQLGLEPSTGGVVISDPFTGEVLANVSYPGFDNNRLANTMDSEYYNSLLNNLTKPLYSKATQQQTAPGSTFKMVAAAAALTEGIIEPGTTFFCEGEFEFVTPHPRCWSYPYGCGGENVITALGVSCNVFFYHIGYELSRLPGGGISSELGLAELEKYSAMFGFDQRTRIELPEAEPRISDAIAVASAIGQGTNNFTVSQLNRYVATVAAKGTVHELTLLKRTTDVNGVPIIEYTPRIVRQSDEISSGTWDLLHEGMREMILRHESFRDFEMSMGGKTGTAEQSEINPDHALFVGFAPFENPEIAIAVRIPNGYTSTYAAAIARNIVRVRYQLRDINEVITGRAAVLDTVESGD